MTNPYNSAVNTKRVDGNIGVAASTANGVFAVFACAPKGSMLSSRVFSAKAPLVAEHDVCEGTEFSVSFMRRTGAPVVYVRLPTSTNGSYYAVDADGITGTTVPVFGGVINDAKHYKLEVLVGGVVGTTGIVVRYSADGGTEWKGSIPLGTALSITLEGGGEVTLTAATTLNKGDKFEARTYAPRWSSSDIAAGFEALKAQSTRVRAMILIGDATKTDLDDLKAGADDYQTSKGRHIFCFASYRADRRIDVRMTGPAVLTFAAATDTILRSIGDWIEDGFVVGDTISLAGSDDNDGSAKITALTATLMTTNGRTDRRGDHRRRRCHWLRNRRRLRRDLACSYRRLCLYPCRLLSAGDSPKFIADPWLLPPPLVLGGRHSCVRVQLP